MNELDKKDAPEVTGGYTPRPGDVPCTDPPTFPNYPELPGLPFPEPRPGDPRDPLVPHF